MKDTSPEVEQLYRSILLARSPAERLAMACDMFTSGRALVIAGLRATSYALDGLLLKKALLRRLYGQDLSPQAIDDIESRLGSTSPARDPGTPPMSSESP